jgi:hypothetical protein
MPFAPGNFAEHLSELKRSLSDMSREMRLLVAISEADNLIDLYLMIAALNKEFHRACEPGTFPMQPLCGTA